MLGTVFLRDLRARVRVKSYEKYVYLGFPWEFEGRRGTIRRPYAPSRMPYRSHGHPRNFDIFDLWGPWGGGVICICLTHISYVVYHIYHTESLFSAGTRVLSAVCRLSAVCMP